MLSVKRCNEAGLTIDQIDGVSTYPGRVAAYLGFSPVGADELIDALGIRATWHAGGGEITSQLGAVVAAADAVRAGLGAPCHLLPHRLRSCGDGAARRISAAAAREGRRLLAMDCAVQRAVGSELDRAIRDATREALRPDARATGADRDQRSRERSAQSARARARAADDGRVHVRAHDLDAAVPVRLRPLHRCLDGADRVCRRRDR